jgi:hypothetical protein
MVVARYPIIELLSVRGGGAVSVGGKQEDDSAVGVEEVLVVVVSDVDDVG